jgi:ribosomal protein S20
MSFVLTMCRRCRRTVSPNELESYTETLQDADRFVDSLAKDMVLDCVARHCLLEPA